MRGQLSDQDLINYALNDGLEAHERLYIESMLAVSEECRNDVYRSLELAQMLETGFERESAAACDQLTPEQRERLLHPQRRHSVLAFLHKSAAAAAIAACVAFAIVHAGSWEAGRQSRTLAQASGQMTQMVAAKVTPTDTSDFAAAIEAWWETVSEDSSLWIQTASDALPQQSTICTPPSWPDGSVDFAELR
jgi:hypothetical protein